jgi:hypothetical protein
MKKTYYLFLLIGIILLFPFCAMAQPQSGEEPSLKLKKCYTKNGLGLDLGIGTTSMGTNVYGYGSYLFQYPTFAVGFRFVHHFNPYLGMDFLKINFHSPFRAVRLSDFMNFQFMTGVRGNTPAFFRCMSGYGVARLGYGLRFVNGYSHGVAFETELGLNITRYSFIAFSYNLLSLFVEDYPSPSHTSVLLHTCQLRIGFNFGK